MPKRISKNRILAISFEAVTTGVTRVKARGGGGVEGHECLLTAVVRQTKVRLQCMHVCV